LLCLRLLQRNRSCWIVRAPAVRARLCSEPHLLAGMATMTDELTFLRKTIRAYRNGYARILDLVAESQSVVARDVMQILRETQWRLDKLRTMAPESMQDPATLRERKRVAPLEEWR